MNPLKPQDAPLGPSPGIDPMTPKYRVAEKVLKESEIGKKALTDKELETVNKVKDDFLSLKSEKLEETIMKYPSVAKFFGKQRPSEEVD